ncbi:ABC transporter membrane-spanning protein [Streptomyces albiaxialis]|uniref:ABC transporter membrane-spanning protein n=1 Tax=Streptomyces albiaxialis TaxID=329523 RepID=A0ABN2W7L1_9ACTN
MSGTTRTTAPDTGRRAGQGREREPAGGNALAGTGVLFRFALRRDRVRLPVWVLALFLGTLGTANNFKATYADAKDRANIAETLDSPAGRAMTGPSHYLKEPYDFGAMLSHQMIAYTTLLVGLMSVLMVVRHTRAEEETGRAELVRAGVVGRYASLTAALAVAVTANVLLALLLAVGLPGLNLDGIDSQGALVYAAVHAVVGFVFAAVAAITVQFTEHTRAASGMALAVLGAAFALRAAGDVGNGFLSWLSPIGWAQRAYPFVDDRWWPVLLGLGCALVLGAVGYRLSARRDVGAGLRPARRGAPRASDFLTTPLGFALRLHRGLLAGFTAGLVLLGMMYGSLLSDVEQMIEDIDQFKNAVEKLGGSVTDSFAGTVMIVLAVVASVYVVMAALRPRAEETGGRAEPLLATGLSRTRWMFSHLTMAVVGGTLVLLAGGLGIGASGAASVGEADMLPKLLGASLAYAPALWVTGGVAAVLFAWVPRAGAVAWIVPIYGFVTGYLGQLFDFPGWMKNLSPFGHVPQLPAEDMSWTPMLLLTLIAVALFAAAAAGFRRRDLEMK